ncbi:hypothetical protein H6P81_003211 [Aristolochia fimbriata]|uniref:Uncharacterized protein n=1 Tax=Aristolochia fimbriata TaxID=158543 RepID=A0AAV7FGD1_ARIFI|nr:hypothetical protein H6P81_003211 [Aristolochia fimbriata]
MVEPGRVAKGSKPGEGSRGEAIPSRGRAVHGRGVSQGEGAEPRGKGAQPSGKGQSLVGRPHRKGRSGWKGESGWASQGKGRAGLQGAYRKGPPWATISKGRAGNGYKSQGLLQHASKGVAGAGAEPWLRAELPGPWELGPWASRGQGRATWQKVCKCGLVGCKCTQGCQKWGCGDERGKRKEGGGGRGGGGGNSSSCNTWVRASSHVMKCCTFEAPASSKAEPPWV